MTSIPRLCIILGTWSGLALGVTNPLMAQSAPDLVALATSPESDEVLVKKDQTRLKGRIRSVSDSSINFKPAGGLARQLDNDGHVIVTWFGVTNAKLVAQAATDRVLLVDRLLQQVSTGDGNETDLIAKIQRTHQEVTDLLDAIPRFENQQAIDDLPLSMRLAAEHARILRLPTKGTSARPALVDRLKAAGDARKNIVSLRKRLSVVEVALQTRRFKDVQRDGPVLIQEIKERQQILRDQRASIEGYQEFRTALGLLTEMATSLAENQPLLLRQPALATLDQDLAAMSDVVRPADAQLAELPILGKPVIEALAAEFQLYQAHIKRFTRYRELTDELRTVMTGFENLVTRTTAQATVNEAQLASQIAAHETRLKSLIGALKSQEPPDLATIATRESEEFTRRSQERSALLLMRKVDMPRITQELRGLSDVRTRTVARQMLTELEARAQRLQHYLDQNRLPLPTDQTDCRNMLQIVKANMERLTSRMQEFDLNETRDEFVKQTTLMDGFLENAVDSELAVLVNRLQQVEKAIDQIEQGYRKRLEGAAATATGSEVLLRDFSKSKEPASEVIEFLALRQELDH
ncbi:MAG TPA: hypothetical protein VFG20_03565, partial [Planctomycetaceae bacterium]|nr:hypothetical protein [Planctomycetaceae bacterium]